MAAEAEKPRVYHISIRRYLILWWALGPFLLLGLGLAIFSGEKTKSAGIAIVCLMVPFFVLWHWLVRKSRLEISSQGVRLREVSGDLEIAWPEITGLRMERGHEGFITAQRFIPIKAFAFHLRSGDMRGVILGYAPHLKGALGDIAAQRRSLTDSGRRRNWIVAGVVAAALAMSCVLIAKGERWQAWFFTVAYGLLHPLVAILAAIYAWLLLRKRNWMLGVLFALLAIIMACWAVNHWKQFQRLLHDARSPAARLT